MQVTTHQLGSELHSAQYMLEFQFLNASILCGRGGIAILGSCMILRQLQQSPIVLEERFPVHSFFSVYIMQKEVKGFLLKDTELKIKDAVGLRHVIDRSLFDLYVVFESFQWYIPFSFTQAGRLGCTYLRVFQF